MKRSRPHACLLNVFATRFDVSSHRSNNDNVFISRTPPFFWAFIFCQEKRQPGAIKEARGKRACPNFSDMARLHSRRFYRLLSIQRDIIVRSRKHSCGTARRFIRAMRSAKATCFDDGSLETDPDSNLLPRQDDPRPFSDLACELDLLFGHRQLMIVIRCRTLTGMSRIMSCCLHGPHSLYEIENSIEQVRYKINIMGNISQDIQHMRPALSVFVSLKQSGRGKCLVLYRPPLKATHGRYGKIERHTDYADRGPKGRKR